MSNPTAFYIPNDTSTSSGTVDEAALKASIADNAASISFETSNRISGDSANKSLILTNTTNISTNATAIVTAGQNISAETIRAKGVEASNTSSIATNTTNIATNATSITSETTRATGKENTNAANITTEVNRAIGVESTIQATLNSYGTKLTTNNIESAGSTLSIASNNSTATLNLGSGNGIQTVNVGQGTGTTTINLGGPGDTVNISGTLTTVNTTNTSVSNKTMLLNAGGAPGSSGNSGLMFQDADATSSFMRIGSNRDRMEIKPANSSLISLNQSLLTTDSPAFGTVNANLNGTNCTATIIQGTTLGITNIAAVGQITTPTLNTGSVSATGNITANSFTGPVTGTSVTFTKPLVGDVTAGSQVAGVSQNTVVQTVGGQTATAVAAAAIAVASASTTSAPSTIAVRNASEILYSKFLVGGTNISAPTLSTNTVQALSNNLTLSGAIVGATSQIIANNPIVANYGITNANSTVISQTGDSTGASSLTIFNRGGFLNGIRVSNDGGQVPFTSINLGVSGFTAAQNAKFAALALELRNESMASIVNDSAHSGNGEFDIIVSNRRAAYFGIDSGVNGNFNTLAMRSSCFINKQGLYANSWVSGLGLGTSGSASTSDCVGSASCGKIFIATSAAPAINSTIVRCNFAPVNGRSPYDTDYEGVTQPFIVISPADSFTASMAIAANVVAIADANGFTLYSNTTALNAYTVYKWNYIIMAC